MHKSPDGDMYIELAPKLEKYRINFFYIKVILQAESETIRSS